MKKVRLIPVIALAICSCSKPAQMEADVSAQTAFTKQDGVSLLMNSEITDFYLDYTSSTGYGSATVHFTNNTFNAEIFQIELKSGGSSSLGWKTANVSANSGVYVTFNVSPALTSGTLTAKVTKSGSTTSASTSVTIYNATTNPGNPVYKATALASNPVMNLKYYYNPTNQWKYYTPELEWTSFSNVVPNTTDKIYAAIKYPSMGGSCLYPEYKDNDVKINKLSFNSVSNENYICKPAYLDYVWDKKPFRTDTVSNGRWIRVYFPSW
ncbi:hypothetical protein [Chitinophaga nivalis]|uniref:Uncharacterized protein n=1 Tax=Chitinophaga nivalis TaxID=2991709 RepID=A0ABT3IK37_9BACT|nr:hypothetical protein [Chitinophaga nivalis]MCW3466190.1 hypothetical protein [Chitinophaga nivalis]MCW3484119.1 hypothetical protein [Chitinophaga nivalis]